MKKGLFYLVLFTLLFSISTLMLVSREFTYGAAIRNSTGVSPLILVFVNSFIFINGAIFIVFSSKLGNSWYQTGIDLNKTVNREASSVLDIGDEEFFAFTTIIKTYTKPGCFVWFVRIYAFILCGVSGFDFFGNIIHMN